MWSAPLDRYSNGGRPGDDAGAGADLSGGGGRTRNELGEVDRVADPPPELLPVLYALKMQCSAYNIDMHAVFVGAGGTHFGTIQTSKFHSALVVTFHRIELGDEILEALARAYGCGSASVPGSAKAVRHGHESCAWKDFCEDVAKAVDVGGRPKSSSQPPPLTAPRPKVRGFEA